MTRRYAVVGLGAVGGLYGGRLAADGHEVHVVTRSDGERLRSHGLVVESPAGDLHCTDLVVHTSPATVPAVDAVLVAWKTTSNGALAEVVGPLARRDTLVAMFQNGLGVEDRARAALGPHVLLAGALCFVCAHKVGPGHVCHLDYGAVTLAAHADGDRDEPPAAAQAAVEELAADLAHAGVDAHVVPDLRAARWRKLVWNVPFNGLSVLHGATTDELLSDPAVADRARRLMEEVRAGAAACGRPIEAGLVDRMLADTRTMAPYATSMKLDADAGKPLEIEAIYDAPLTAARAHGVELAEIAALAAELRAFVAARTAGVTR